MDSSAWLIREILPSGSEPTSRLCESCPFRFITNLWLNASKDTAILKPAYSPMTAGALTVFISLHISTRAVPASFLSVKSLSPTFMENCSLSTGRFTFVVWMSACIPLIRSFKIVICWGYCFAMLSSKRYFWLVWFAFISFNFETWISRSIFSLM